MLFNYTVKNNTYFATPKDNPNDLITKEIGDSKTPAEFLPQQKIMRWDNECNVSIRLKDNEIGIATVSTDKDKIIWSKGNREAHFYDFTNAEHPEGASEFEVVLKSKPKTNVVEFSVVDKDVDYFYQPELTQEQKDEGASQPENVVGSYAIYAKTPKTNWTGGKEYKCGKVGHIFRPKIIDSAGTEVWGDLHIENGILSVTIPQEFLDKAVYPVRHAAGLTFGWGTGTGTEVGIYSYGIFPWRGSLFTAPEAGNITKLSIYARGRSTTEYLKGTIVQHSDLTIVTNGVGSEVNLAGTDGWVDSNFGTPPAMTAQDYVLSVVGKSGYSIPSQAYWYLHYDAGNADQGHGEDDNNYTTPTNPTSIAHNTNKYLIYATYTAGGAAGPANLKTYNTNVAANIKSINTNLIANVKSLNTNV